MTKVFNKIYNEFISPTVKVNSIQIIFNDLDSTY